MPKIKPEIIQGREIACYDNGGKTMDRYTVVFLNRPERDTNTFYAIGMNAEPFHPQGIGQHTTAMPGRHLGKRIAFAKLPEDCRNMAIRDLILDNFTTGYITAALWAFDDNAGSVEYDGSEAHKAAFAKLAPETIETMADDCARFQSANAALLKQCGTDTQNGHDFWLTRCGHGAGFWDHDYGTVGDEISDVCRKLGNRDLYFGDDGRIYIQ